MNAPAEDAAATLAAWRAQGLHQAHPVRFRFLEALARRASDHQGPTRQLLDQRLAKLLSEFEQRLQQPPAPPEPPAPRLTRPLATLLQPLAATAPAAPAVAARALESPPPPPELKTLRYFRSTWTRLSAEQRLSQTFAKVPDNAGPLNSQHLVHRSLLLMRDVSPEYLSRFMAYVDTLLWLDQATGGGLADLRELPRNDPPRKSGRRAK